MIRYDLTCARGHAFSAWFSDSRAFEEQAAGGLIDCPMCGNREISKQLMRPAVSSRGEPTKGEETSPDAPGKKPAGAESLSTGEAALMRQMAREVRAMVRERAEYVGERFAAEARRRHAEGRSDKPIWGEATASDARELTREGIDVMPLPPLPDDKN